MSKAAAVLVMGLVVVLAPPLTSLVPSGTGQWSAARADIGIIGDDDEDAFVGNGSLLLPPQMATDWRSEAADCPGCSWRSVVQCDMTTASSCRGPARLCGVDAVWLRVYLTRPGGVEQDLGAACFGSSGPVSRDVAEALIRDQVRALVPPLRLWRQPAGRVLPHLPVVFGVDQPDADLVRSFELIGLPVDLTVRPRWAWDFGTDRVITASPGRRWPHETISHTYRRAGSGGVAVTAIWEATYTVAGVGPLKVAESVTQEAAEQVPVGEARAVLVR